MGLTQSISVNRIANDTGNQKEKKLVEIVKDVGNLKTAIVKFIVSPVRLKFIEIIGTAHKIKDRYPTENEQIEVYRWLP